MAYYKCGSVYTTQNSNVVVDTASGAVANFQTPLAMPLLKTRFDFKATQEAGTPTPQSPKAISGVSAVNVIKCSVNLWNEVWEVGAISNTTGSNYSSDNYWRTKGFIPIKPNTEIYISSPTGRDGASIATRFYDKNKNYIGYTSPSGYRAINRKFTTPDNAYFLRFNPLVEDCPNHDISVNYPASDTEYHAYNPNSDTTLINLGGTYYGGYVSQDKDGKRELVVTHDIKLFSELSFGRSNNSGVWEGYRFYALVDKLRGKDVKCSHYEAFSVISASNVMENETLIAPLGNDYIYVKDDNYTTVEAFKTANTNTQLWYELAEPFTVALPDGEPIKSLPGINNIFADTGDTAAQFRKIG